jgi:hypothetical protein
MERETLELSEEDRIVFEDQELYKLVGENYHKLLDKKKAKNEDKFVSNVLTLIDKEKNISLSYCSDDNMKLFITLTIPHTIVKELPETFYNNLMASYLGFPNLNLKNAENPINNNRLSMEVIFNYSLPNYRAHILFSDFLLLINKEMQLNTESRESIYRITSQHEYDKNFDNIKKGFIKQFGFNESIKSSGKLPSELGCFDTIRTTISFPKEGTSTPTETELYVNKDLSGEHLRKGYEFLTASTKLIDPNEYFRIALLNQFGENKRYASLDIGDDTLISNEFKPSHAKKECCVLETILREIPGPIVFDRIEK